MSRIKVHFNNKNNEQLEGVLELPDDRAPHNFAIFAHCFTCSKNLIAIANISRGLVDAGFGVLRFDFTGLGESEGDFSDTNFSGNVHDLIEAARFLEKEYKAPALLVGHSLGGTASLFAAEQLPSVKAVAVIGSPADPEHVVNLLRSSEDEIKRSGKAIVNIGGRHFTIKKQFLDDLNNKPLDKVLQHWNGALLIIHSPQDEIVGIENAEKIFRSARHPKSFVSLDKSDHMMSNRDDSRYVGEVISSWVLRYVELPEEKWVSNDGWITASLDYDDKYTTYISSGNHKVIADEPVKVGGHDYGPNPYDYVSIGLATCTAMTMHMYARHKEWNLKNVTIQISHAKEHATDCANCDDPKSRIDRFVKKISMTGDLTAEQHNRLMEIADRCPVHRTLLETVEIESSETEN